MMENSSNQNKQLSQYKETQILTASPGKLLLMLYDGALVSLQTAMDELKNTSPQYDVIHNHLIKAQEIIGELLATLDLEKAEEIALSLQSLYSYFIQKLIEANIHKKVEPIEEVFSYMQGLRDSWEVAVQKTLEEEQKDIAEVKKNKNTPHSSGTPESGGFNISG